MATTNDLKNGMVLNLDGELWTVVEFQHVKPGKGGAFVRTKLKNVLSGKVVDKTFNAGVKVETASVDKREMQYLYQDGDDFVFMDTASYDQLHVPGPPSATPHTSCSRARTPRWPSHDGTPLYVELPAAVELVITLHRAGPAGRPVDWRHQAGDARDRRTRSVPLFITQGERIKVDTRDGSYLGRACN